MARAKANKFLEPAEEVVVEEVKVEETPVIEEEPKPKRSTKKAPKVGKVANCGLLNVRERASVDARIIKCLSVGSEIEILGTEGDFYKIADGFVMKAFIAI